jgi:hypothetical protein
MVTTPVQKRASIVMLLIGAVGGAVGGWFAHRAFVVRESLVGISLVRDTAVAPGSEPSASESLPAPRASTMRLGRAGQWTFN